MPHTIHSPDGSSLLRTDDLSSLPRGTNGPQEIPSWQEGSWEQVLSLAMHSVDTEPQETLSGPEWGGSHRLVRDCHQCATALALAKDARDKQRIAEEEVARARESERRAYAVAQDAFVQVAAARREIDRTYGLLGLLGLRTQPSRGSAGHPRVGQR